MITSTLKKSRSVVQHQHHQPANDRPQFGIEQTSAFLKHEIGEIIKTELKAYHLRNKLQVELEDYNKQQENKKLARTLVQDRMNDFREKQRNYRRKQFEIFQKRQKDREVKLRTFMRSKEGIHENKCSHVNQAITNVRDRYFNIANEDASARLSKLAPCTSEGKRMDRSSRHSEGRALSISQTSSRVNVIKTIQAEQEKFKITNYLNKIQRSESRVLLKEIENGKRRESSMKKKVKCLIGQRKKNEEDHMDKAEREYKQRMATFANNHSRIVQTKELTLLSRVAVNARAREQIAQRRDQIHKDQIDRIITNYNSICKQNLLQQYRSTLDLNYTQTNKTLNLLKKKAEDESSQLQHNMRILVQKMQKLKNVQYGEKLDDNSIKTILTLMDKSDPEYSSIVEFLKSERMTFIQGIVRREEEKSKLKKMNKAANKTNPL